MEDRVDGPVIVQVRQLVEGHQDRETEVGFDLRGVSLPWSIALMSGRQTERHTYLSR